jgi:hypothetical protein
MILIATYDSDKQQDGEPHWHNPMPRGRQYWFLRMLGYGSEGSKSERQLRPKHPCTYQELREALIAAMIDEIREEVGGVVRFQFWVYKAR